MRYTVLVILIFITMAAPSHSVDFVTAPEIGVQLPGNARQHGFFDWEVAIDVEAYTRLASEGDPLAQWFAYRETHNSAERERLLSDMRRRGNPATLQVDMEHALSAFPDGKVSAEDLRAALHGVESANDHAPPLLELLDFQQGRFLPRDGEDFRLPEAIGKGNSVIDGAACRFAVLPWQIDMTLYPACRTQEERGDAEAAWRLGLVSQQRSDDFYEDFIPQLAKALDVQPNLSAALDHYRRAAAGGHAAAQARLAYHAALGRGMVKDTTEAVRLAKASAAQGHPEGMAVLGLLTLKGIGIEADPAAAAALIRKAAERGSLVAQYTLASLLFRGKVVAQDFAEGLAWLRLIRFSKHGDMPADEYGELMVEPWPRTVVIGNMLGRAREVDLETQARAARLRQDLANDGRWPYRSEVMF